MLTHKVIIKSKTIFLILLTIGLVLATVGVFFRPVHAQTWVEGHITTDTTWTVADSPYRAINDVIVDPGVLLTIEPGVEVQFADGFSLTIEGSLTAEGTDANPIIFTSSRSSPSPGAWNTIKFIGGRNEFFTITYSDITYATNGITIGTKDGKAIIRKCEIQDNSESGIMLLGSSNVVIEENTIRRNKKGINTDSANSHSGIIVTRNRLLLNDENGIYLHSYNSAGMTYLRNVTISYNNVSASNGDGICLESHSYRPPNAYGYTWNSYLYNVTISYNNVLLNNGNGIHIFSHGSRGSHLYNVTISSNSISSSGKNGMAILTKSGRDAHFHGVTISSNTVSTSSENGIYLSGYATYDSHVHNVTIASNVISSSSENGIYLHSYTNYWQGHSRVYDVTISSNVVSNNNKDGVYTYSWGTYEDTAASIYNFDIISNTFLFNGRKGIHLHSESEQYSQRSYIYNVTILSNTILSNVDDGIYLLSQPLVGGGGYVYNVTVSSNIISSNLNGIRMRARYHSALPFDTSMSRNVISDNVEKGIGLEGSINANLTWNSISYNTHGFYTETANNWAEFNDIYRNTYGMMITNAATVKAEHNYWGHSTGPYHQSLNPEGQGNSVNGDGTDLDFIPFLTSPVGTINQRPVAVLEVDKTNPNVNETVTFDASVSTDDGRIDYYFFDFGDGTNSSWTPLSVVTHKYASEGTYNASLIVIDDFGVTSTNTATKTIFVGEFPSLNVLLTLNPTTIGSEGQVSVNVHVTDGTIAIEHAYVQLVSDKGGSFTPSSGYTDLNGDFSAIFTAPSVSEETNVRITATASKSGYADGSDYEYLSVLPPGAPSLSVTVTANPSTVKPGETSTITVKVTDGVNRILNATVTLSSDNGGTFSQESGNTDSNGVFTSTFTAPSVTWQTTCTITAHVTKTGYFADQGQTQVTVKPQRIEGDEEEGIELFWIIIAVAVMSIAVVIAIFIARRERREKAYS